MRFIASLLLVLVVSLAQASDGADRPVSSCLFDGQEKIGHTLTEEAWLTRKPGEIATRTGTKMNFFERMALRAVQKKVRKENRRESQGLEPSPGGLGGASLALGLLAILSMAGIFISGFAILFALLFGILGTIYGAKARSRGDRSAVSLIGLILSIIGGGMAALAVLFLLVFMLSYAFA